MSIHILKGIQEYGPHEPHEVQAFVDAGLISLEDIVVLDDKSQQSVGDFLRSQGARKLTLPEPDTRSQKSKTESELKKFLVAKGLLVRKDQHEIGSLRVEYGSRLSLASTILSIGNSGGIKKTYGVVLSHYGEDGDQEGTDHIDFDELAELIDAFTFMRDLTVKMRSESIEYTEVKYATREGTAFGFYQKADLQQAFVKTDDHHKTAFLSIDRLSQLQRLFEQARAYLEENGANEEEG